MMGAETTVYPSAMPELPLSDRSEVHFKCGRQAGSAGSRFKACPPRRTRQLGITEALHLVCSNWGAAAAKYQVKQVHLFCVAGDLREGHSQCLAATIRSNVPPDSWSWIFAKTGSAAG